MLPELASSGYVFADEDEAQRSAEDPDDGPTVRALRDVCASTGATSLPASASATATAGTTAPCLIGASGRLATYRKLHLYYDEQSWFKPGDELPIVDLPFGRVGMIICFDLWFPEPARALALAGAEIIAVPTNWVASFKRTVWDDRGYCQGDYVAMATAAQNGVVDGLRGPHRRRARRQLHRRLDHRRGRWLAGVRPGEQGSGGIAHRRRRPQLRRAGETSHAAQPPAQRPAARCVSRIGRARSARERGARLSATIGATALLEGLNPPQREAVEAPDGPLLIFAGAGSGKTRVLTHRIAYVIATRRVRPDEICAVTFTNKAAREMRARVEQLIGDSIKGMWLGTFHSLGARLLRREGEAIGIPPGYTIYDEADRLSAIRNAIRAEGIDEKRLTPSRAAHAISAAKNELLDARDFQARVSPNTMDEQIARIYWAYERELDAASALDFDDLLLRAVTLFREADSVREYYQDRFLHLFVDEYQDTNKAQYELVKILGAKHRNVTVVGDDDQCLAAGTMITMADGSRRPVKTSGRATA